MSDMNNQNQKPDEIPAESSGEEEKTVYISDIIAGAWKHKVLILAAAVALVVAFVAGRMTSGGGGGGGGNSEATPTETPAAFQLVVGDGTNSERLDDFPIDKLQYHDLLMDTTVYGGIPQTLDIYLSVPHELSSDGAGGYDEAFVYFKDSKGGLVVFSLAKQRGYFDYFRGKGTLHQCISKIDLSTVADGLYELGLIAKINEAYYYREKGEVLIRDSLLGLPDKVDPISYDQLDCDINTTENPVVFDMASERSLIYNWNLMTGSYSDENCEPVYLVIRDAESDLAKVCSVTNTENLKFSVSFETWVYEPAKEFYISVIYRMDNIYYESNPVHFEMFRSLLSKKDS